MRYIISSLGVGKDEAWADKHIGDISRPDILCDSCHEYVTIVVKEQ